MEAPIFLQISCRDNFLSEVEFEPVSLMRSSTNAGIYDSVPNIASTARLKNTTTFFRNYSLLKEYIKEPVKKVLVLVHGYRATFESIERKYTTIENKLKDNYDLIIEYYWPASWEPVVGFVAASARVDRAAFRFAHDMLSLQVALGELFSPEQIVISAHSLGCKLVTTANYDSTVIIDPTIIGHQHRFKFLSNIKFILASPAINIDEVNDECSKGILNSKCTTVVYSKKDWVLKYAFRMSPANWASPAFIFKQEKVSSFVSKKITWFDMTNELGSAHGAYHKTETYFDKVLRY